MTSDQLKDEKWLTQPMPPTVWLLRVMLLQPERIRDPKDVERWIRDREAAKKGRRK